MPFIFRLSDAARLHKWRAAQFIFLALCLLAMLILVANAGHAQSINESEFSDAKRDIAVNASRTDDVRVQISRLEEKHSQMEHLLSLSEARQGRMEQDMEYIKNMLHVLIMGVVGAFGKILLDLGKWFVQKASLAKIVAP